MKLYSHGDYDFITMKVLLILLIFVDKYVSMDVPIDVDGTVICQLGKSYLFSCGVSVDEKDDARNSLYWTKHTKDGLKDNLYVYSRGEYNRSVGLGEQRGYRLRKYDLVITNFEEVDAGTICCELTQMVTGLHAQKCTTVSFIDFPQGALAVIDGQRKHVVSGHYYKLSGPQFHAIASYSGVYPAVDLVLYDVTNNKEISREGKPRAASDNGRYNLSMDIDVTITGDTILAVRFDAQFLETEFIIPIAQEATISPVTTENQNSSLEWWYFFILLPVLVFIGIILHYWLNARSKLTKSQELGRVAYSKVDKDEMIEIVTDDDVYISDVSVQEGVRNIFKGQMGTYDVAVKQIPLAVYQDNRSFQSAFTEIQMMTGLDHQNIIKLLKVFERAEKLNIIMELLPSQMEKCIESNRKAQSDAKLTRMTKLEVAIGCCNGVAYIHGKEVVHGNICTQNILLTNALVPKLCGFRCARSKKNQDVTKSDGSGDFIYEYGAPELYRQDHGKPQKGADVWALACCLVQWFNADGKLWNITGAKSHDEINARISSMGVPDGLLSVYHQEIENILRNTFKQDPVERPDATELKNQFDGVKQAPIEILDERDVYLPESPESLGTGRVVKGSFKRDDVAIKLIKLSSTSADEPQLVQRALKEIKMLGLLEHKNVVKKLGSCVRNKEICIVMDLIPYTMRQLIESRHIQNECTKIRVAQGCADGLKFLHERDVIHNRITTENILLTRDMVPKLCGLGLAEFKSKTSDTGRANQLQYSAPELFGGEASFPPQMSADVWALACTLVQWFNTDGKLWDVKGKISYPQMSGMIKNKQKPSGLSTVRHESVKRVLELALEYDAKKRLKATDLSTEFNDVDVSILDED